MEQKNKINLIKGEFIFEIGRCADMLWLAIGDPIMVSTRKGMQQKRKYAIDVQCPWRIRKNSNILLSHYDIYRAKDETKTWDIAGNNMFDEFLKNCKAVYFPCKILSATINKQGDLRLTCSNRLTIEAFVCSQQEEEWRFISFAQREHTVFFENPQEQD